MSDQDKIDVSTSGDDGRALLGVALITPDSHVRSLFDEQPLAFGAVLGCCQGGCTTYLRAIGLSLETAADLIASLQYDAKRQGRGPALQAAVDGAHLQIKNKMGS